MTSNKQLIDLVREEPPFDLAKSLRAVTESCGKTPLSQVSEIAKLSFGTGKLSPEEYFYFHLYDDSKFSFEDKKKFVGKSAQFKIVKSLNPLEWWSIPHDKLVLYGLLSGLTYAVPATQALYHAYRQFAEIPTLRDPAGFAAFLRDGVGYPFFGKPVTGVHSVGVTSITAYDAAGDALIQSNGDSVPVERYVESLEDFFAEGYILQDRLEPHPEVRRLCGDHVTTVRLMVLLGDEGPSILHALWKMPAGENIADNYWRDGNLLAALDAESGQVLRVIQGFGIDEKSIEAHPDTGQKLVGVTLPDWDRITGHTLACATSIPGLRLQSWDVAICPQGPVMVEVNTGGDFNLPQIATNSGMLGEVFGEFLERYKRKKGWRGVRGHA